jgi:hypothetical protein
MSVPHARFIALSERLCSARFRQTVVLPVIADLQFERAEAIAAWDRRRAVLLACGALFRGGTLYAALLPWSHVRRSWFAADAAGPVLLRLVLPRTGLCGALFVAAITASEWPPAPTAVRTALYIVPSAMLFMMPLAVALGVGLALCKAEQAVAFRRAGRDLGWAATILAFALAAFVVPRSNARYREGVYRAVMGSADPRLPAGDREMTLGELGSAIAGASAQQRAPLMVEWHKRLALPALCGSLVISATLRSRSGVRSQGRMAFLLFTVFVGCYVVMRAGEQFGDRGLLPAALAAWGCHAVPLLVTVAGLTSHKRAQPSGDPVSAR